MYIRYSRITISTYVVKTFVVPVGFSRLQHVSIMSPVNGDTMSTAAQSDASSMPVRPILVKGPLSRFDSNGFVRFIRVPKSLNRFWESKWNLLTVKKTVILPALKGLYFAEPVLIVIVFLFSSLNMVQKHSFSNRLPPRDELYIESKLDIAYISTLGWGLTYKIWTTIGSPGGIDIFQVYVISLSPILQDIGFL